MKQKGIGAFYAVSTLICITIAGIFAGLLVEHSRAGAMLGAVIGVALSMGLITLVDAVIIALKEQD